MKTLSRLINASFGKIFFAHTTVVIIYLRFHGKHLLVLLHQGISRKTANHIQDGGRHSPMQIAILLLVEFLKFEFTYGFSGQNIGEFEANVLHEFILVHLELRVFSPFRVSCLHASNIIQSLIYYAVGKQGNAISFALNLLQ